MNSRHQQIKSLMTRRRALHLASAAATSTALSRAIPAFAITGKVTWPPNARLNSSSAAVQVDPVQFMNPAQMRSWYEELDDRGLRATGSKQNESYIDVLHERMLRAGVLQVREEAVPFDRWVPSDWGIDIVTGSDAGPVATASYVPYSGYLPAEGSVAPLVYVAAESTPVPGSLRGKIALLEVKIPPSKIKALAALSYDRYDPSHVLAADRDYARVWLSDTGRRLTAIRSASPLAVIAVLPLDDTAAAGMYTPYDGVIRSAPGLFVAKHAGDRLKKAAAAACSVRVRLTASTAPFQSRNLLGILPGRSKELIILQSHTDGTNGIEDDGPDLIISMAQYLSRIPSELLPRTILVLLTTGHFVGGAGSRAFLRKHREDILPQVAASITIEHVGAKDWAIALDGSTSSTGLMEPAVVFMPPKADVLAGEVVRGLTSGELEGTFLAGPTNPHPKNIDTDSAWPGEGEYLWNNGGLPEANYITGPNYLFNGGYRTVPCVDFTKLRQGAIGFTDMALALSRVPAEKLKVPPPGD